MGGYGRQPLRHELVPSATVAMGGPSDLLAVDGNFKHYLDCYWQHFHPLFPIIHHSSFLSVSPPPLLVLLMVVIGAQFSFHPESKTYSAFLYEYCVGCFPTVSGSTALILAKNSSSQQQDPIAAHSCLSDMQTVILLEAFSRYRARGAKVENIAMSSRFRALYSSVCFAGMRLEFMLMARSFCSTRTYFDGILLYPLQTFPLRQLPHLTRPRGYGHATKQNEGF